MWVVTLMLLSWWLSYVVSREQLYANRQVRFRSYTLLLSVYVNGNLAIKLTLKAFARERKQSAS